LLLIMESSMGTSKNLTVLRKTTVLVAAFLIGLAYNLMTPLGVAFGKPVARDDSESVPALQRNGGHQIQLVTTPLTTDETFADTPIIFGKGSKNLSWPQTQSLLASNQIVLVDARHVGDFQTEHIPGAISLSSTCTDAELAAFASKYPRDTALVVYCESRTCPASHNLARRLRADGYTNVRVMPGGIVEYRTSKAASQR
jgi:rhodanese-related sulfurtransferase